ncbi:MAG: hypothetical protein DYH12_30910, partial [Sorangiineae bacterium PRO1]|nr:hypothetical protein [Sorangiineae bacterium PRO1]
EPQPSIAAAQPARQPERAPEPGEPARGATPGEEDLVSATARALGVKQARGHATPKLATLPRKNPY